MVVTITPVKVSRRVLAVIAAVLAVLGTGPQAQATTRVTVAGRTLMLDGRPWWPSGFNAYELGTDWSVNRGCGAQVDLDSYFSALPPNS